MRTFVIGDIHGCFDELMELTAKIGLTADDILVSLGDIVDRGNKSKEVYDYFISRPNSIVLIGNHERKHQKGILRYAQEIVKVQFGEKYKDFQILTSFVKQQLKITETILVRRRISFHLKLTCSKADQTT